MKDKTDPRLHRLLGGDALSNLRKRLRQRYERGASGQAFRLGGLSKDERATLAGLLGRPARLASSMKLEIVELDAVFQNAGVATSLRDALERIDGPIVDRVAQRIALQAQWNKVRAACADPRLAALLGEPQGLGQLKRLARNNLDEGLRLLDATQTVLRHLPTTGTTRSQLAAESLGDAHGLDPGRIEATLVLTILRRQLALQDALLAQNGAPVGTIDEAEGNVDLDPEPAAANESIRTIWASAGVLVNELARPALFLNVPLKTSRSSDETLGQPCYLSLRALVRSPPQWDVTGRDVYVCENPNLVAIAADALGGLCAPLACTDGMPAAAQRTLLKQLAQAGARLNYHGDFDWAGLRIGNWIMRECCARPWRYGARDYLEVSRDMRPHGRLLGRADVSAEWDDALAPAMRTRGFAVDEEAVAKYLLSDLELLR